MQAGGHQAGEVGHVDQKVRVDEIGDAAELGENELPGVGRAAGHDQVRAVAF